MGADAERVTPLDRQETSDRAGGLADMAGQPRQCMKPLMKLPTPDADRVPSEPLPASFRRPSRSRRESVGHEHRDGHGFQQPPGHTAEN